MLRDTPFAKQVLPGIIELAMKLDVLCVNPS